LIPEEMLMREVKTKSVVPLYVVAGTWMVYALCFPIYKLWHVLIAVAVTTAAGLIARKLFPPKVTYVEEPQPEPEPVSYGDEVDGIIKEGRLAIREMARLYVSIKDPTVREKINELMTVSDKIITDAIEDPSDVPQIKKFINYFMPTTIKLLHAYDRMSDQGIEGENISGTMGRIEDMLDTAIVAYKKQLDSLFANQALDIETDIEVMNAMLAREGLAGKDF